MGIAVSASYQVTVVNYVTHSSAKGHQCRLLVTRTMSAKQVVADYLLEHAIRNFGPIAVLLFHRNEIAGGHFSLG